MLNVNGLIVTDIVKISILPVILICQNTHINNYD